MGACSSAPGVQVFPTPPPETLEEWARLGVRATERCHRFVGDVFEKQAEQRLAARRGSRSSLAGGAAASPMRARFDLIMPSGEVLGDIVESPETLAQVREMMHVGSAPLAPNLLTDKRFVRLAQFLVVNRSTILEGLASGALHPPLTMSVGPRDFPSLVPELSDRARGALLNLARSVLARSIAATNRGAVTEDALERWLSKSKASIGDSIFLHIFFRTVRAGPWPRSREAGLTVPEFVQAVDRFCTFSSEQLVSFAFFALARVGIRPGEVPFIAVSSLSRLHPELNEAASERGHASRAFYDEMHKRQRAIVATSASRRDVSLQLLKAAAFRKSLTRGDEDGSDNFDVAEVDEDEDTQDAFQTQDFNDVDDWGDGVADKHKDKDKKVKGTARERLCTGPDDLMSLGEFQELAVLSPLSVFDLAWMQMQMRKEVLEDEAAMVARRLAKKEERREQKRAERLRRRTSAKDAELKTLSRRELSARDNWAASHA